MRFGALSRFFRDPLFLFVCCGVALFGLQALLSDSEDEDTIVVSTAQIQRLIDQWSSQTGAEPTESQLDALVDEYVIEEAYVREARLLGLDTDDVVVRQRLAQKLRFLNEDTELLREPSAAELRSHYEENSSVYSIGARTTFHHIYFSPERRENPTADAEEVMRSVDGRWEDAGDPFPLGQSFDGTSDAEIRRQFGSRFLTGLSNAPIDKWSGPIVSAFGVHLVKISHRTSRRQAEFEDVVERVKSDFDLERRSRANDQLTQDLVSKYRVIVQQ